MYQPRKPQESQYHQCVEDHFERLEQVYDEIFARQYRFFRPYVRQVIYRYLDCGILHNGFARVKCRGCGHEYLLASSCKRRHFCPSCLEKRVVQFGEWLCEEDLKAVPHRHFTFSLPKTLRRYLLYDRILLSDLIHCTWESRPSQAGPPSTPQSSNPQHDVLSLPLTQNGTTPYTPSHLNRVLITPPKLPEIPPPKKKNEPVSTYEREMKDNEFKKAFEKEAGAREGVSGRREE
jgi:ribosomal protein S27E